jgi:hypothetical protein
MPQTKLLFTHYYHYVNYYEHKHIMSLYRKYKVQIKHLIQMLCMSTFISSLTNFLGIPFLKPFQLM